jgi:hypothetical protein
MNTNPVSSESEKTGIFNRSYEAEDKELLLEQYKLYVEMHDRISARRSQANSFFISLLSGLLAIFSISSNRENGITPPVIGLVVGSLGTVLCALWNFNIRSYRRIVDREIHVMLEMEKYLPFYCYNRESTMRAKDLDNKTYLRPTSIEQLTSIIFLIMYLGLMIYSLLKINLIW